VTDAADYRILEHVGEMFSSQDGCAAGCGDKDAGSFHGFFSSGYLLEHTRRLDFSDDDNCDTGEEVMIKTMPTQPQPSVNPKSLHRNLNSNLE